jgi:glycyl-tRNA synthetase beta chain
MALRIGGRGSKACGASRTRNRTSAEGKVCLERFQYEYRLWVETAALRALADAFFEKVTVNAPEPELRLNRLRLLNEFRQAVHEVADFLKIAG